MNFEDIKFIFVVGGILFIAMLAVWLVISIACETQSLMNVETTIVNATNSDIIIKNDDFYIEGPDGEMTKLGISNGEVLDLTKHSDILIKFKRYPPYGVYEGSGWFVDGVVKKQ